MKFLLSNEYVVWTIRVILGLSFIVAGLEKAASPEAFAMSIANYKLIPASLLMILATMIPWIELIVGFSIIFGIMLRGSSLLSGSLLAIFTLVVLSALVRGLDISCGCYSQDPDSSRIGLMKLAENAGLIVASVLLYFSDNLSFSLEQYLKNSAGKT